VWPSMARGGEGAGEGCLVEGGVRSIALAVELSMISVRLLGLVSDFGEYSESELAIRI
jgi:hypothetical protein